TRADADSGRTGPTNERTTKHTRRARPVLQLRHHHRPLRPVRTPTRPPPQKGHPVLATARLRPPPQPRRPRTRIRLHPPREKEAPAMSQIHDAYQAAQADRQERDRVAAEKAAMLSRPANEQVAADLAALQAATRAHMVEHARRTGATPERIRALQALTPTTTPPAGNRVIDPATMQPTTNEED